MKIAKETGVTAMGGHVRRFNPSHQYVHKKIKAGELKIQQMDVQTYFFRRKNINAAGNARSWTDHLLWHHAAHTIDLFQYQAGENISDCYAVQGPIHPQLNIAMDMGIVAKTPSGAMLTLSLSFNNDGPLGSFFRYICDNGTYKAFYDDLSDGKDNKIDVSKVDVSMDGIELEDREFIAAIKEKREPNGEPAAGAALHACARQAREDHRSAAQGARVVRLATRNFVYAQAGEARLAFFVMRPASPTQDPNAAAQIRIAAYTSYRPCGEAQKIQTSAPSRCKKRINAQRSRRERKR